MHSAFRRTSRATGLRFRYAGPSSAVPLRTGTVWPAYDSRADITVAWANGRMFDTFGDGVLGVGGSSGDQASGYTAGLGLGHASDRRLVMNPALGSCSWARYGRGTCWACNGWGAGKAAAGPWRPLAAYAQAPGSRSPLWLP